VAALPHVRPFTSPYGPAAAGQISRTARSRSPTVHFDELGNVLPKSSVHNGSSRVAQRADSPQLQVELGGQAIENAEAQSSSAQHRPGA